MIIYFTGLDGSGKSTLINELKEKITVDEENIFWLRYSPKLFRYIINIFKKKKINTSGNYNKINSEEYEKWKKLKKKITSNKILNKMIFYLFFIEYFLQIQIPWIKIKAIAKNKVVIIDRFVLDFLVDQSVNFGDLKKTFAYHYIKNMLTQIDLIFYIDVTPETAISRKKDIPSLKYLKDRQYYYFYYLKLNSNIIYISNDGNLNKSLKFIKDKVDKYASENFRN